MIFPFDPDITRASTIPSRLYVDPVYLALEEERVFGRTWQCVGRAEQLTAHGSYLTAEVAREQVVVLRDGDALRGYHNICLHRAGPVASGCGVRKTLQCKYHGWTYDLRGQLIRAPGMEGSEGFDAADFRLMPVQAAQWGPLVFVNLDLKAPALEHFLEDIPVRTARFHPERMRFVQRASWDVACNWKVYVDNFLEGYHVAMVHPGLYKELDVDHYRVEPHRYYSLQHAPLRPLGADASRTYVPVAGDDDAQYYWLFPNLMLNIYQGQLQTNHVIPRGHDRCEVVFEWFAAEPPEGPAALARWQQLITFTEQVQDEDVGICEQVQRNLRSRSYDRGRYSAKHETGVHHFHSLLHEFMT